MITSEPIRELCHNRASTWDVKRRAIEEGMLTLRDDGWRKAISGKTTVDEVLRVTKGDRI